MAKNIDNEQERIEQNFHDHINGIIQERTDKWQAQIDEAVAKAAEHAKRCRKRKLAREVAHVIFAAAGIAGLYVAETAGLISAVLTGPVYAIAFISIGWHLCKIDRMRGRR
jgi:hypothetical protein